MRVKRIRFHYFINISRFEDRCSYTRFIAIKAMVLGNVNLGPTSLSSVCKCTNHTESTAFCASLPTDACMVLSYLQQKHRSHLPKIDKHYMSFVRAMYSALQASYYVKYDFHGRRARRRKKRIKNESILREEMNFAKFMQRNPYSILR